ncbi:hypothetical protein C8Q73DRAFT_742568 [Cubamyces lactineus]|nr:hypothetical protein C8Q73DRAFT_742568 [Cubamyces lactineus]
MLQQKPVRQIAHFGSSLVRLFAPRMYAHYSTTLASLCVRDPSLKPNFARSVFSCSTFNLGPHTITRMHTDHLNLPFGWCSITALKFLPGSTILIPSAILRHCNTPVAPAERRYSFTQFSPGGIFRWAACSFRSAKDAGISAKELSSMGPSRWEEGLGMLSKWSELQNSPL